MNALITVLDNITETSMPFNEFVLYRANHYAHEKQIVVICGEKRELPKVDVPDSIDIRYVGRSVCNIRKTIKGIVKELENNNISYAIHVHQVQSGFLSEISMLGTGFRKKVIFSVHSTFSGYRFHNKVLSFINALAARYIVCVSYASYKDYPKIIKRIKGNRIQAILNGVDTERIDKVLYKLPKRDYGSKIFIYVARLIPLKNHRLIVRAITKCDKSARFMFVGAEDNAKSIRRLAEEAGVADRITFTGLIPRNEVYKLLQSADYYISSSTLEGLPISVLEAMYCGLPCILSDIPQHREIANDDVSLLPIDDEDAWAKEIDRYIKLEQKDKDIISTNIRENVVSCFSLAKMHSKYDQLYVLV